MIARLLPHPVLTATLVLVWLMLLNSLSLGGLLLGLILGVTVPLLTAAFWPERPRIRHPLKIIAYVLLVLWDIFVANIQIAYVVVFKTNKQLRSHFITIPLEIYSPEAITMLAGTITMTPGTVSSDLSADGRSLLVHCLDTDDPQGQVDGIKARYEARLKEIFE
ncbi:Na+/H+ antiporter subunit E [Pelagibius litoralis]|uniref:Na+/H+ antiporter subunit E n=1 Tax=Pelagibius litoralis TaxID=374515 RepID=A0A967C5X9_9PROT|nr:Na+/H+ antiporter subunit E [Pelagibius litoralis]NIA67137.1 Na+/H+ antiporter subunit E [Pelagibius litoralis]